MDFLERFLDVGRKSKPQLFVDIPVPKSEKFKTINEMLHQVEIWRNKGDLELEKKHWNMIAEKAKQFTDEIE